MNTRGFISVDYLFAFIMVFSFTLLLLAISLSLSVVEVSQYISFSAARAYYASHFTPEAQKQAGQTKLQQLLQKPAVKVLYQRGGLFEATPTDDSVGRHANEEAQSASIDLFQGVQLNLNIKMLDFQIPMLGSTAADDKGFKAQVASYLSREVTYQECKNFVDTRWQYIQQYIIEQGPLANKQLPETSYQPIIDNGC